MINANEIMPYYLVFHPLTITNPNLSFHSIFPSSSHHFWALHHAPTAPTVQSIWPEKTQNISTHSQHIEVSSPPIEAGPKDAERKVSRRPKNKRLRNSQKQLESAKKNSESNLVNQLYSFFNSYEKSESVVQMAIGLLRINQAELEKVKSIFYNIVRLINYKRGRKYVNKENILSYYTPDSFTNQIPDINQKLEEMKILSLEDLCFLFRVTTNYFIRNISVSAILTSKRITTLAKHEHLKRRRRVQHSLAIKNQ